MQTKTIADVVAMMLKLDQTMRVLEVEVGYMPAEPDVMHADGTIIGRRRQRITFITESAPGQVLVKGGLGGD
jgi:hypothetical protein